MFHWFGTVTNTKGDSLPGWQIECVQLADGTTVIPIFADENQTPIISLSGISDRAKADSSGNYDFFVQEGTYSLRFYDTLGNFQRLQRYFPMYGNAPEAAIAAMEGAQAAQTAAENAAAVAQTAGTATIYATWADLNAAIGMSAGDSAVVFEDAGTHTDPVVGGTVANAGIYIYSASPAGWERVANTEALSAADSAAAAQAQAVIAEGFALTLETNASGGFYASVAEGVADVAVAIGEAFNVIADGRHYVARKTGVATGEIVAEYTTNTYIPATSDYASQAMLEAATPDWFMMPTDTDFAVTGALAKNFFGPGSISLAGGDTPGTQGDANYGFSVFQTVTPGTGQNFTTAFKVFSGTRYDTSSAPGQDHSVALYTEAQRGSGSDSVWAFNPLVEVRNLNGATIGIEVDVNNFSGSDPGLSPAQAFHALSLISGASGRGGTALVIDRNGDYASNEWNRGIHVKEVLLRGIEFTNCGAASGFWSDRTMAFVGTAATDNPIARFTPFNDTNPGEELIYLTDAANTTVLAGWLKRGEIAINQPSGHGAYGVGIKGIANGDNLIFLQRNTDTAPTGTFLRAVNAANTTVLFDVDYNTVAAETNLKLSVAGASAARVSVGAADSGGAGYRVLRVPN